MAVKKRTADLDWDDLRYFVALSSAGSLSAASRSLKVNHATVARRIARLEATIGRQLFQRSLDGYALTVDGRAVFAEVEGMQRAALAVLDQAHLGREIHGLVRLTTTRSLAETFLAKRLAGFVQRHPEIDLEILAELRVMSLARHEADLAIRLGRPRDSDLVGHRLGQIEFAFYGLAGVPPAKQRPALIAYDEGSEFIPEARWLTSNFPEARLTLRSNSQQVQLEAARAGLGLALLPHYVVVGDPQLRQVDLGKRPPARDVWLLSRREARRTPRVRAVADYIVSLFASGW